MSAITDLLRRQEALAGLDTLPLFFIGGLPRSGTTWLQKLTDAHPEIVCLGESQYMGSVAGRIGRLLISHALRRDEEHAVWAPASRGLDRPDIHRVLQFTYLELIRANTRNLDLSRVRIVGEKTPENLGALPRIRALFPDAKFVHVIRDGRDGAISAWSRFRARLPEDMTWHGYVGWYAREWAARNLKGLDQADPERTIVVRYEDLHRDPRPHAERLFGFLGVGTGSAIVDAAIETASFERLSGGRKPGQVDAKSHYRRGEPGGWRLDFDARALEIFEAEAGEAIERLGYSRLPLLDAEARAEGARA